MKKILLYLLLLSVGCFHGNNNSQNSQVSHDFDSVDVSTFLNIEGQLDSTSEVIQLNVPNIKLSKQQILGSLESVFDSIIAVKLDTNDSCIVGNINQATILNDTIYIRDTYQSKSIFVFDITGRFINTIGKVGNGPFEYIEPSDMHVTDSTIIVYDQWQHKLLTYNHSGVGISDRQIPFICNQVMQLSNGNYLFRGINSDNHHIPQILDYGFWLTDSNFVISKIGLNVPHGKYVSEYNNLDFWRQNNIPFFYNYWNNTVYNISETGKLYPKYHFNFSNNQSTDILTNDDDYYKAVNKGEYIVFVRFSIVDNIAVYTLTTDHAPACYVFQDLKNNKSVYFNTTDFFNGTLSRCVCVQSLVGSYNGYLLFTMSASLLCQIKDEIKNNPHYFDNMQDCYKQFDETLLKGVSEQDNDVLILGLLKQQL